jgi:hypothetical protein
LLKPIDGNKMVNTKTGEILYPETVYRSANEVIKICEAKNNNMTEKRIPWKTKDKFIKLYVDNLREIISELTGTETMVTMFIIPYIDYYSNMLKSSSGFPISNSDIVKISGFSEKYVSEIMDSLVTKRIFSRNRIGRGYQYFANPFIFTKGNRINATLFDMFKNYKHQKT